MDIDEYTQSIYEERNTDSARKLATVQTIIQITKHPDADKLSIAKVMGWDVIIRNDEFSLGEKIVYCEIDSMLPTKAEWLPSAIKSKVKDEEFYRLKTTKIRGVISQGLIVTLPEHLKNLSVGDDVTKILGIEYFRGPAKMNVFNYEPFPKSITKTDEPRIQSHIDILEKINGKPYYITTKLDGMSATYLVTKGNDGNDKLVVCSRNYGRKYDKYCIYWRISEKYNLHTLTRYAIQGEICGPNIQCNRLMLKKHQLFVFNIIDLETNTIVAYPEFLTICESLKVTPVPVLEEGDAFSYNLESLLEKVKGKYNSKYIREGIVIRTKDQEISFKVINNDYIIRF